MDIIALIVLLVVASVIWSIGSALKGAFESTFYSREEQQQRHDARERQAEAERYRAGRMPEVDWEKIDRQNDR